MVRSILFCFAFISLSAAAQQFTLRNYSVKDGLPQSQVNVMVEDANGYLWIGTHGGGLARFDGREFKVFTTLDGLVSNIVTYLKIDSKGNIWVAHPRGISKYDGGTFVRFSQNGSESSVKRVRRIFEFNDTIFFHTSDGTLGKIYNDSLHYWSKNIRDNIKVAYYHVIDSNQILLYTNEHTFELWLPEGIYRISHEKDFKILKRIFNYKKETVLITDQGYFDFNVRTRRFTRRDLSVKNIVLSYDTLKDIFWTRWDDYLLKERISKSKHSIDTVLREVELMQVLVDSEDNTWFATSGSGIYKYFTQDFDRCSSEKLRGIMAIHVDRKGNSWIGSGQRGLWKMSEGKATTYVDENDTYRSSINCIAESENGTIWVGTGYGLGKSNESKDAFEWYNRKEGLSTNQVLCVEPVSNESIWIGTLGGGLNYYDGKYFTRIEGNEALQGTTITALHFSDFYKELFVGHEFGLSCVKDNSAKDRYLKNIENTSVLSITAFQDSLLLIGTGGAGVILFNPGSGKSKSISTHDGLPSDFIYFVAPDEKERIWIGTEKGITRIRLNENFEMVENLHYDYDNGLTGVETNHNAYFINESQKYFGLIDGLYQYNELDNSDQKPFDVHLTQVEIFYGQVPATEYASKTSGFFKIPVNPILPADKNHITFYFNRVDKRYSKSTRFKYYLENFDQSWSKPSQAKQVTYSNLPPGYYKFRVMSTNNEGSWSNQQIAYPFFIRTPFYQTSAFIASSVIILVGVIFLFMYVRVRSKVNNALMAERIRMQGQDALRKEIARDFHDEMGNQLTRIINYVSLMKMNNGTVKSDLYTKVEESAKYLYTGTRDFIWAIDPVNDELGKLFIHIRDFGEKLFEEKSINFRAYNDIRQKVKLPFRFSREANLIFKEVMTNAFKHSEAKNVKLKLERVEDSFILTFEDDGVGFNYEEVERSNGLKNMRERAERAGSYLRIETYKNTGTWVTLEFKLKTTKSNGTTI